MKSLIAALTLMTMSLTAACGTANDAQTSNLATSIKPIRAERVLFPINGSISSVAVHAADAPAQGLWTEVEVEFNVDCMNKFEHAAVSYEQTAIGTYNILVSAYVSAANIALNPVNVMVCQAFSIETAKVTLPGIVDESSMTLINLNGKAQDIPNGTASISSIEDIKVVSTRSLCPEGTICKTNGTVVTLSAGLNSCVNSLGPVSYKVEKSLVKGQPMTVTLTVNALEFHAENAANVRCFAPAFATTEISLPMIFADADSLNLRVIQ